MYFFKKKRTGKRGRILAAAICLALCVPGHVLAKEEPSLYATAAVLMDADTGRVLYEKNGEEFLSNASTTKIMTWRTGSRMRWWRCLPARPVCRK